MYYDYLIIDRSIKVYSSSPQTTYSEQYVKTLNQDIRCC